MRISDWRSDVCSSDLNSFPISRWKPFKAQRRVQIPLVTAMPNLSSPAKNIPPTSCSRSAKLSTKRSSFADVLQADPFHGSLDRNSVVSGKSVSVRVDPGGGCILKKKKQ